jgi:hypothetical protein
MNAALSCIEDTLRSLLEEAKQAEEAAAANRSIPGGGFEVGRSETLAQVLHTWSNQIRTFELDGELDGVWDELKMYLSRHGF